MNFNKKELTKEEKIRELQSKIRLCESDLNGIFRRNPVIEEKMKVLNEQLEELKKQE